MTKAETTPQAGSCTWKLTGVSFSDGLGSEEEAVFIIERVVMETAQVAVHFSQ